MPTVLYFLLVITSILTSGDMGGPLNFVIVPAGSAVAGIVLTMLFYLPAGLVVDWWTRRQAVPRWLPFAGLAPILALSITGLAIAFLLGARDHVDLILISLAAAGLTVGLTIQWAAVLGLSLLLSFLLSLGRRLRGLITKEAS